MTDDASTPASPSDSTTAQEENLGLLQDGPSPVVPVPGTGRWTEMTDEDDEDPLLRDLDDADVADDLDADDVSHTKSGDDVDAGSEVDDLAEEAPAATDEDAELAALTRADDWHDAGDPDLQDDDESAAPADQMQGAPEPPLPAGVVVHGNLEHVLDGRVSGWATLSVDGVDVPLPAVRIVDEDGNVLVQGTASDFRQDVSDSGVGGGWCAFDFDVSLVEADASWLVLEVRSDDGWHRASQYFLPRRSEPTGLAPPPLLAAFSSEATAHGVVSKDGLRFGSGVWLQASKAAAGSVSATLHLVPLPTPSGEKGRTPILRVESQGGGGGRVDLRFALGAHSPFVLGEWVSLRVLARSGSQQLVRLNVHDHRGRTSLGDFVVQSHSWSTLQVKVPAHHCEEDELEGEDATIWLELILDASAPLDVSAPVLSRPDPGDVFECLSVQAQSHLFEAVEDRELPAHRPFSVVIPFFGKAAYTASCALSVAASSWSSPEIILVDDGSQHPAAVKRLLADLPGSVRVVRSEHNRGYTAGVNAGVQAASHDIAIILNNDTRVTPGWDAPLLSALDDPTVFAAGPLSNAASYQSVPELRQDGGWAINHYGPGVTPQTLSRALRQRFAGRLLPLPILNGFCYAVRREQFLELDGLDEASFPHGYGEEVDLMMRANKLGLRNVVTPDSFVYHYKSITFGAKRADLSKQGNKVVQQRWGGELATAVRAMDADMEFNEVRASISGLLTELGKVSAGG